jgi:hypothetical protein
VLQVVITSVKVDGAARTAAWVLASQVRAVLDATTLGATLEEADYACARLKSLGIIAEAAAEIDHAPGGAACLVDHR